MLEQLKREVYEANMLLPEYGLVTFTWGNVSGISREQGRIVIKPSGVEYESLSPENMAVTDLDGRKMGSVWEPSSDTPTHAVLYERFLEIGGIVHTHSPWATSWAQAGRDIPCYGTTHADYIFGEIPCVRGLTREEIEGEYEKNTGLVIAEELERRGLDPLSVPVVLCRNHGVFAWIWANIISALLGTVTPWRRCTTLQWQRRSRRWRRGRNRSAPLQRQHRKRL